MGTTKFTGWYNVLLEFAAGGVGVVCVVVLEVGIGDLGNGQSNKCQVYVCILFYLSLALHSPYNFYLSIT